MNTVPCAPTHRQPLTGLFVQENNKKVDPQVDTFSGSKGTSVYFLPPGPRATHDKGWFGLGEMNTLHFKGMLRYSLEVDIILP